MGPNNWFYINVMLDNSELFIPLPDQLSSEVEHALNSKLRGVALRWEQLRVGYFFGGDGEKILRLNAHELSMIGRLPEVVHSQVFVLSDCRCSLLCVWHVEDCRGVLSLCISALVRLCGCQESAALCIGGLRFYGDADLASSRTLSSRACSPSAAMP